MDKSNSVDFDIRYIFKTIFEKWYIVVVMIILSLAFVYYKGYHRITTIYESTSSLIVGNSVGGEGSKEIPIDQIPVYAGYAKNYLALGKRSLIAEKVSQKLNNRVLPQTIQSSISLSLQEGTPFIDVRLIWNNPKEAVDILTTFNEVFIIEAKNIYPTCTIQIMEDAKEPRPIIISNIKYVMAAPFIGIILAVLIIFGIDLLDNTIRTEEDIKEYLNLSVIGEIPKEKKIVDKISSEYINKLNPSIIEAFRTLRTNIEFISTCNNLKSVMVSSGRPGEGKTLTATILSAVLAQSGKRTILIDCDLRNPNIHKNFKVSNDIGLTNYLAGKVMLSEVVSKTSIENLFVLTSGVKPPNPAELLGSPNIKALIRILRNDYDYIVFDTPPVGLVTDALVVAQIAYGCILVAASGSSVKEDVVKSRDKIKNVGGKLIGVVLNKIKDSRFSRRYSYYYLEDSKKSEQVKA